MTKNLVKAKLIVVGKLLIISQYLVDTNLFSVGKYLGDTNYLASVKMFTNLDISARPDSLRKTQMDQLGRSCLRCWLW